ncbi:hypothetical protein H2509_11120 [Stappia sp. F7233]|uniref:Uncharacterized protein n=1 Tax=Stappia albiluteola TaxID=2758565 RepID=A0A839AFF6_9HYPH|nr:hypothetical protein [Stappia albiluteola]MBA5777674.1 hypothetical protein [Stappia albiluteola]
MYRMFVATLLCATTSTAMATSLGEQNGEKICSPNYKLTDEVSVLFSAKNNVSHIIKHSEVRKPESSGNYTMVYTIKSNFFNKFLHGLLPIYTGTNVPKISPRYFEQKFFIGAPYAEKEVFEGADLVVLRSGQASESRALDFFRETEGEVRKFGERGRCEVVRVDKGYEISKALIILPVAENSFEDQRCLYTGMYLFYGANDFDEVFSDIYHYNHPGLGYVFHWSLLPEMFFLYDDLIAPGMGREEVLSVLRLRMCKN